MFLKIPMWHGHLYQLPSFKSFKLNPFLLFHFSFLKNSKKSIQNIWQQEKPFGQKLAAALKQMLNLLQFSQMLKSTSLATIDSYKHLKFKLFPRHLALQFLCTAGSLDSKTAQIRRKTLNNTKIAENIIFSIQQNGKDRMFQMLH